MFVKWISFGEIEVDGERVLHDVVIDRGTVRKRRKGASKIHKQRFGHTPLSLGEELPWHGSRLLVGTGAYGRLPVMDEVREEAQRRNVELVAMTTPELCRLIAGKPRSSISAVLHITC